MTKEERKQRVDFYKEKINKAQTSEELHDISYQAFLEDSDSIWTSLHKKNTLTNIVTNLCVEKELFLEGYSKAQIKAMQKEPMFRTDGLSLEELKAANAL